MDPILEEIVSYKVRWYLYPALFASAGIVFYLALTSKVKAYARSLKSKLGYFLAPYFPKTMLIIGKQVLYDNEYEVIKGKEGYLIRTVYGEDYTTDTDPDEIAIVKSPFSARGPEGVDSPFSLAWRWLVAAGIVLYGALLGLLSAWMDPRLNAIRILTALGYNVPDQAVLTISMERGQNLALAALVAAIALAWWFANLWRMTARGIKVSSYVPLTVASATIHLVPSVEPDSPPSVFKTLSRLVRTSIKLELSPQAEELLGKLANKMKTDIEAVVQLLNQAAMADLWRREKGHRLEDYQDIKEAAIAECQLKAMELAPKELLAKFTRILAATAFIVAIIAGAVGYALGIYYGAPSVEHPNTTATYGGSGSVSPSGSGSVGGGSGNGTITPAPPPTPPITPTS